MKIRLNKHHLHEEYISSEGFVMIPEDENIIDEHAIDEALNINTSGLVLGDVVVARIKPQFRGDPVKSRPMCVVLSNNNNEIVGFQLTSQPPKNTTRTNFRCKVNDSGAIRAVVDNYINYDHFVKVKPRYIGRITNLRVADEDLKSLYFDICRNKDALVKYGYKSPNDKNMLIQMMNTLKKWYSDLPDFE